MGVDRERSMEAVGFVEWLAAPGAKRRWSDEAKGRIVAETLVPGVTAQRGGESPWSEGEPSVVLADVGAAGQAGGARGCGGRVCSTRCVADGSRDIGDDGVV